MRSVWLLLSFLFAFPAYGAYVGNTYGSESQYRVFEFSASGNPVRSISGFSLEAAWPSAIKIGNVTRVYAAVRSGGKWLQVHRWSSTGGAAYMHDGVVFSADAVEAANGFGPITVTYDGSVYRLFYTVLGPTRVGHRVQLAESADGTVFTRIGNVYSSGAGFAPDGVTVSYACTDGTYHYLFLHGYVGATASSFIARATTPNVLHVDHVATVPNDGVAGTISGLAGNAFGVVNGSFSEGQTVIIKTANGPETYIVTEIIGNVIHFNRPLVSDHTDAPIVSFIRSKADLSFARKLPSGAWIGAVTGYGQFPAYTSEYTSHASASSLSGPWNVGGGYFLSPYFNSGWKSTENPEPIRTSASCSE